MNITVSDTFRVWNGRLYRAFGGESGQVVSGRALKMSSAYTVSGGARPTRESSALSSIAAGFTAIGRLVLPVIGLLLAFAATYLYRDAHVTLLDDYLLRAGIPAPSPWLTWSHILLPSCFFVVHLTNRRYGPNYAIAQVLIACVLAAALGAAQAADISDAVAALAPVRESGALAVALFFSLITAAAVFDRRRGIHWWHAPLSGSLWAGFIFALIFYPVAYAGTGQLWVEHMVIHFAIMAAMAVLFLIPYGFFRPLVKPLPGFGGY